MRMNLGSITYPAIPIHDEMDDDTKRFAEALNWQNERLAIMAVQTAEMYEVFETLKPLMANMPVMPKGLIMPGRARG